MTDISSSAAVFKRLRALCPTVSVGVLTADLMDLGRELKAVEEAGVGVLHLDVMDGVFCPMMTVGPQFIRGLSTRMLKDVHLMVHDPIPKLADYVAAGADLLTVHVESTVHIHRALQEIGRLAGSIRPDEGVVRGVALNPGTPLETLEPLLGELEMVVLLAVDPGWTGQRFIPSTFTRAKRTKEMIAASGRDILLCIDGGVTRANIAEVAAAGADLIVTGSAVFDGTSPGPNAEFMLAQAKPQARGTGVGEERSA